MAAHNLPADLTIDDVKQAVSEMFEPCVKLRESMAGTGSLLPCSPEDRELVHRFCEAAGLSRIGGNAELKGLGLVRKEEYEAFLAAASAGGYSVEVQEAAPVRPPKDGN